MKYRGDFVKEERVEKDSERFKIRSEVFDHSTLMILYKLQNRGYLSSVESIVSTGKEANIFYGLHKKKGVAIKIFRTATSSFRNTREYISSDPRFEGIRNNRKKLTYAWAKREFKNLMRVHKKIKAPRPITVKNNVLLMDFLGEKGVPYPRMKDVGPKDPEENFKEIIGGIKKMYDLEIVHSDLSEYNILTNDDMFFIDFPQGTVLGDPNAHRFLKRDIKNIVRYFSRYIETSTPEEIYKKVI
ncbi:MAG: serine protein kinase RIO [Euryarchaeota archaeon]|nr:serine protein kinase RIO [Euryarchaeota archaeon]